MDASFGSEQLGTNEAPANAPSLSKTATTFPLTTSETKRHGQSIKRISKPAVVYDKHDLVSTQHIKYDNERKSNECTVQNSVTTQGETVSSVATPVNPVTSMPRFACPDVSVKSTRLNRNSDRHVTKNDADVNRDANPHSVRSLSSPQLTIKPITRSKVYRKASLKSMNLLNTALDQSTNHCNSTNTTPNNRIINISNCSIASADEKVHFACRADAARRNDHDDTKDKWNTGEVHITCNPLSTPYPYSTPHRNITSETVTESLDDEPRSRSCGSFLPILSLIPQTVVSLQYLSPKMKFSWWRNKIS